MAEVRLDSAGNATYRFDVTWELAPITTASANFYAVHIGSIGGVMQPGASVADTILDSGRGSAIWSGSGHDRSCAGYLRSRQARSRSRSQWWRHPFLQEILVALKTALSGHGLHLLMLAAADSAGPDARQRYLRAVRRHNLDGLVIIDSGDRDPAVLALADGDVPCVALDLRVVGPTSTYVTSDNAGGAALAARHLVERGHRRIATIAGPQRTWPGTERLTGFRAALAGAGLALPEEYVVEGDFYLDGGQAAMRRLLALAEPPTAVFAAGDEMAIGAMRAIAEAGLRVPDDVAVVGFDDIDVAALVPPGLTTLAQDKAGFGTAAAEALVAMLRGGHEPPEPTTLPATLVVRGST